MAFGYFTSDANFWTHPKMRLFAAVASVTEDAVIVTMTRLWNLAATTADEDGQIGRHGERAVAALVGWTAAAPLLATLEDVGLLDADGCLHGWRERYEAILRRRERDRDRKRDVRSGSTRTPRGLHADSPHVQTDDVNDDVVEATDGDASHPSSASADPTAHEPPVLDPVVPLPATPIGPAAHLNGHVPPERWVEAYHAYCCPPMSRLLKLTEARRRKVAARAREKGRDEAWVDAYFERAAGSRFLRGERTEWRAGFDFLVRSEDVVTKIQEGQYDDLEADNGWDAAAAAERLRALAAGGVPEGPDDGGNG